MLTVFRLHTKNCSAGRLRLDCLQAFGRSLFRTSLRHESGMSTCDSSVGKYSTVSNFTVPTDLERTGDFSQSLDTNGALRIIKDPTTGSPFPQNKIPTN